MALKDIENKIISDAEKEAERIISIAKEKASGIINSANKEAEDLVKESVKQSCLDSEKEVMQVCSLARITGRDNLIVLKRQFIKDVYITALNDLGKVSKKDYESIVEKILGSVGSLPSTISVISPKGKEKQTEEALKKALSNLKIGSELKFSKQTFNSVGGFILNSKEISIDGSFESLLDGMKNDLEQEVVKVLFGGSN